MNDADSSKSGVNEARTPGKTDTPVTQPRSGPVLYELIDKAGNVSGSYLSPLVAATMARDLWPDQEQDEDRTGKGWDIQVVGS